MYVYRRNKVMKATKMAWLGNNLPLFRGDSENTKKLNDLVKGLKE